MSEKKKAAKRRGRPPSANPKGRLVGVRLDDAMFAVVEAYQKRERLDDPPSAIRHMIRLIGEGAGVAGINSSDAKGK